MNNVKESLRKGNIRDNDERKPDEKPISLHPLKFEETVKNLLRVKNPRGKLGRDDGETND